MIEAPIAGEVPREFELPDSTGVPRRLPELMLEGGGVAVVSVDSPERSEALRVDRCLPFPMLCDTERRVVREWGVCNTGERGGLARPAVFVM
jgi:peroxiredoxin